MTKWNENDETPLVEPVIDWRAKYEQEHYLRCDLERRFDHRLGIDNEVRLKAQRFISARMGDTPEMTEMRECITYLMGIIQSLEVGPALEADEIRVDGNDKISGDFVELELVEANATGNPTWAIILTAQDPGDDDSVTCIALDVDGANRAGTWLQAASSKLARLTGGEWPPKGRSK